MDELDRERGKLREETDGDWATWCEGLSVEIDEDLAGEWWRAWDVALSRRDRGDARYFADLETILEHVRTMFQEYKDMLSRWRRAKETGQQDAARATAAGSPVKRSPTKKGSEWCGSSRSHKDELLALTRRFWAIVDPLTTPLRSEKLTGHEGARTARSIIASCAYIEPLRPTPSPPAVGSKPLIDRFLDTTWSLATTSTTSLLTSPAETMASTVPTLSLPEDEDDDFDDYCAGTRYSQISSQVDTLPAPAPRTAAFGALLPATASSSQSTGNPVSPLASRAASPVRPSHVLKLSFRDASGKAPIKFCFDMAHRDVLNLKANGITRRLHGENSASRGIGAPCVAESMLDVMQVSKRCSGIASARSKIRPQTLLDKPLALEASLYGSPSKRQRTN
ncbi:hypothetical protein JCM10212_000507 [Sporobolomyces blumeae]